MIDLTILIVSYETRDLLSNCLDSVAKASIDHPRLRIETIVVDNGSRDGSVDVALASSTSPRIVALVRNRGFAAAVNYGLRLRRGRHVLLLNSDAEIEPDVLSRGVEILDGAQDVGVLGVALEHSDGRAQRSVHAFPGLQSELIPELILRSVRPQGFPSPGPPARADGEASLREVEAVRGAVFFMRGDLLEELGQFDEGYFFFLEETDYCWRVHQAGYRVLHCEALRAMHRLGASSKRRVPLATRVEFHRSLYHFLERRRGRAVAALALSVRVVRNAMTCVGLLLPAVGSDRARSRLAERWGLLLWHLRGRPRQPDLAGALRAEAEFDGRGREGGTHS